MKPSQILPCLVGVASGACTQNQHVVRNGTELSLGGEPWRPVGGNAYWLGLDENIVPPPPGEPFDARTNSSYPTRGRITEAMEIIRAMGGTMLRVHTLGSNIGNPLSLLPGNRVINEKAFETMDWVVSEARRHGVRLMVPLVDHYDYYHGGKYNFLRWAGYNLTFAENPEDPLIMEFYYNQSIVTDFKWYIERLLTHVNPLTNLTYAEDPTIFAYESGNELYGDKWGDKNCPTEWVRDIGRFVKDLAPKKLYVDGTYGINADHFAVEEVDIFSDHFYGPDVARLQEGIDLVADAGRTYFAGEYDWTGGSGDDLNEFFQVLRESPIATGDAFWSLFGRNSPNCQQWVNHTDGFTLSYGNPENSPELTSQIQLVRQHLTLVSTGEDIGSDDPLPDVPCV
ncbi:glycoside hydrolase superfamily [Emericellopsis atlantica]|uniref:mannan endo-1,4-beta-mannosidase n=1 Tax=Emericellopsis atlantica TaxID=2614577 RepID=A0A9P7ZLX4_9HYPO|nr:glycoside hydrolase superfamily [Emericellopsis atlantica]KAG9254015.1 glycoside hydrolase superfamily [Emericellopsis atlantica]